MQSNKDQEHGPVSTIDSGALPTATPSFWTVFGMTAFGALEGASIPLMILSLASLIFVSFPPTTVIPVVACAVVLFGGFFVYDRYKEYTPGANSSAENLWSKARVRLRAIFRSCDRFLLGVGFVTGVWTSVGLIAVAATTGGGSLIAMAVLSFVFGLASVLIELLIVPVGASLQADSWTVFGMMAFGALEGASIPLMILSLASLIFVSFPPTTVIPVVACAVVLFGGFFVYDIYKEYTPGANSSAENLWSKARVRLRAIFRSCERFLLGVGFVTGVWTFVGLIAVAATTGGGSLIAMAVLSFVFGLASVLIDLSIVQDREGKERALTAETRALHLAGRQGPVASSSLAPGYSVVLVQSDAAGSDKPGEDQRLIGANLPADSGNGSGKHSSGTASFNTQFPPPA